MEYFSLAAFTLPIVFLRIYNSIPKAEEIPNSGEKNLVVPIGRCANCKCFSGCQTNESYTPEQESRIALEFLKKDKSINLAGTQLTTDIQIYILRKNRKEWDSQISSDEILKKLENTCRREFKKDFNKMLRIFWLEGDYEEDTYSILIVPNMIFVQNVVPEETDKVIRAYLEGNDIQNIQNSFPQSKASYLHGTHVFICCHETKDEVCGQSGNAIFDTFSKSINQEINRKLQRLPHNNQKVVYLHKTSCLTGHKYPACLIIVRWDEKNSKYYGDSYGYVTPQDVPLLLDSHILQGKVVSHLFKGRIALDPKMSEKFLRLVVNP